MTCFCCSVNFEDANSLRSHYIPEHDVDENNRDRAFVPRKCFSCEYFCSNGREEKKHNFLLHYKQGSRLPVEDKPLNRTYLDEDLQKY